MTLRLEDFGQTFGAAIRPKASPAGPGADRYDEGYNAGWDDAVDRLEQGQTHVSDQLAERLAALDRARDDIRGDVVAALEPAFRDIFDKLLPTTVERVFLPSLLEEVTRALDAATDALEVLVSPEDVPALEHLLERADVDASRVRVVGEPALAMSQALIRWSGHERRVDLDAVLRGLDDALDVFFATLDRGQNAPDIKEAQNG